MNRFVRIVGAASLIGLGIAHLLGHIGGTQVWVVVGLLTLAPGVLLVRQAQLDQLLARLSKLSVGPFSVELAVAAERAAATSLDEGDDTDPVASAFELRMRLEMKMTYLAKHVLVMSADRPPAATYLTIGSLRHDHYLTAEQAELADAILTGRFPQPGPPADVRHQLDLATTFVNGFRAVVFHALVAEIARKAGKRVETALRRGRTRAHLLVHDDSDDVPPRLVPVYSTRNTADSLAERSLRRLRENGFDDAVVVVPRLDDGDDAERDRGIWTLGHLRRTLNSSI